MAPDVTKTVRRAAGASTVNYAASIHKSFGH